MAFDTGILKGLANKELILPFFELGMLADRWPDSYSIKVDSGPYYGLGPDGKGDGYFHPSTHPLMHPRQLFYMFHPDTKDKMVRPRETLKGRMTLAMGTALHSVVQTQMQMVGLLQPENVEKDFLIEEHHVRGRIDMIIDHPNEQRYICEMKTMNSFLFSKCTKMKPEWDAQMSLQEYSQGMDHGILLLVERGNTMNMREFFHKRNDALLTEIFDKFAMVREAVVNNEPPQHCCLPESKTMQGCAARYVCWLKEDE